jgi:hypothetical protein
MRVEKIIFRTVSEHSTDAAIPEIVEKNIIGRFYEEAPKTIEPADDSNDAADSLVSPFTVLSRLLSYAEKADYDSVVDLYSADTQLIVENQLNDPEVGEAVKGWLGSLESFDVLSYWLESPETLVTYVRPNGSADAVMPFVFVYRDGWRLWSGFYDSEFSKHIDVYYANIESVELQVVYPLAANELAETLVEYAGILDLIGAKMADED